MFSKVALFVASALALTVVAAPNGIGGDLGDGSGGSSGSCNAGPVQCCNTVQSPKDATGPLQLLLGLLNVDLTDTTANVGVTCTPISAIGLSQNGCSARAVCCENNDFDGAVALGCVPANVVL
ncbi:hypothetical protein D9756_008371 [Leucocoprinus leucothites]|uniref:Hydrophobin n=1 Tax=Leucocoprinus leucothites TaxID=201217 RepID=A0A8H5FW66_9AGAR|nr:hypothetical protein D9756_008371 [Leucoagaricus leucothites]